MTKLSPALIDGTSPREPTRAAAPSLFVSTGLADNPEGDSRDDISIEIGCDCDVKDPANQLYSR